MSGCWPGPEGGINPLYRLPFTEQLEVGGFDQGRECARFERNFWKCMEAFGLPHGRRYCDLEYRDFQECIYHDKQNKRAEMIRHERMKQFLLGKRDRPFEKNFPKVDDDMADYFSCTPVWW